MSVNTETSSLVIGIPSGPGGVRLGNAATDLIGFYGITTPIARRGNANQAVVVTLAKTATTVAALTATTVVNTGAVVTTPYGYTTAAQADAIVTNLNAAIADLAALRTQVLAINADLDTVITGTTGIPALVTLVNELRAALVAVNLIKGSA
jgi:hypothetical protein